MVGSGPYTLSGCWNTTQALRWYMGWNMVTLPDGTKYEEEQKEKEIKFLQGKFEEESKVIREETNGKIEQNIKNYIQLCIGEGKSREQTEQLLHRIFSLGMSETKEKLRKYW